MVPASMGEINQPGSEHYSTARFRRGVTHFLAGKGLSALLGLAIFTLTVRLMPIAEYGHYVTLIAAVELALVFNTIGLDWVALRYLPEYRIHASGRVLARFIGGISLLRLSTLLITAVSGGIVILFFDVPAAWWIYIVFMIVDGLGRFLRDVFLETLLLQARSQISLLVRSVVVSGALATVAFSSGTLTIAQMGYIELFASLASLLSSGVMLMNYLNGPHSFARGNPAWKAPSRAQMKETALHNYTAVFMSQAYSPQSLILIAGWLVGIGGAAALGFALRLSDLAKRYLPGTLFISLIRPTLIAFFAKERDFKQLNQQAALVYKISVFSLFPVLIIFALFGHELISLLVKDKYQDTYWLIFGLLIVLISRCHRDALGIVVNSVERMRLWTYASAATLLLFPIGLFLAWRGMGSLGLVIGIMIEEMVSNLLVVIGLRRAGFSYQVDYMAIAKMVSAAAVAYASRYFATYFETGLQWIGSTSAITIGAISSTAIFLFICYFLKPFRHHERQSINRFIKHPVFVW